MSMPTITFQPTEHVEEYREGESIFDVGRRAKVTIETACVGKGNCGLCRVRIVQGEEFLNKFTDEEEKHLGNVYFLTKMRLSCRTVASGGDIVVEVAPARRKQAKKRAPTNRG